MRSREQQRKPRKIAGNKSFGVGPVFVVVMLLTCRPVAGLRAQPQPDRIAAGVELDALPYATGGYFGAVWVGRGRVRGRALRARVHIPEFAVPDGFTNNDIDAYAVLVDVFRDADRTGWWIAGGPVYWAGSIQSEARIETTDYESYLLNGGFGYTYPVTGRLYVSPWAGLSIRVGGDEQIEVDGERYDPHLLNPEASLKFGWTF